MYKINFQQPIQIHFIGIGGISMSGLAKVLAHEPFCFPVSGSDRTETPLTNSLSTEDGISVYYGQCADNIKEGTQLVVYTAAISDSNPELRRAKELQIPVMTRAELLGQLMAQYKNSVGVSGTHGKTTTTSMIAQILLDAGTDPTVSVGGMVESIHGNIRLGASDIFVTEACEYTDSFLCLPPRYAVILNIELDHTDYFKSLEQMRQSFTEFAHKVPADGAVIINGGIPRYQEITEGVSGRVITYGLEPHNEYYAADVQFHAQGLINFSLMHKQQCLGTIQLPVPGMHNVSNAVAAAALGLEMGLPFSAVANALSGFTVPKRRFEEKGFLGGIRIIDDYAHHPAEVAAALDTAKSLNPDRIVCVFQSHTYTRTKAFLKDFARSLSRADLVVLAPIYAARETDTLGISSLDLQKELQELGTECYCFPSFGEIEDFLLEKCINGDMLITMGAGDIVKVGDFLLGQ